MFYNSTDIDERLKCAFCKDAFVDVIKLVPECGESICGLCYKELRENIKEAEQYNCKLCNEWHEMPTKGLPDNKSLLRMLEARKVEKPLSEQAQALKRFIELVPSQLTALKTFDERDHINHHCDQLEVEVIEEIDSLVKHLNEIGKSLLKQIREYREGCLESFSARSSTAAGDESSKIKEELRDLAKDLHDFGAKWTNNLGRFESFMTDSDIEAALNTTKHFEARMRSLYVKLENYAFEGQIMKFKTAHSFLGNHDPLRSLLNLTIEKTDVQIQPTSIATLTGHSDFVYRVIFLGQDKIASCSGDATIKIWSLESRTQMFELKGHSGWVISLALLQNGWLASGSRDKTIKMWNLDQRKLIKTLHGHTASVVSLKTLKNDNLVSYSNDDTIRIWNPYSNDKNLVLTMTGHGNTNWFMPFGILSNDNVVTCSQDDDSNEDCVLRIWNSNDGALVTTVSTGCVGVWPVLVLSNDQVALGLLNGTIKIVDVSDHSKTRTREKAHMHQVTSLEQLSTEILVSSGRDSDAWNIKLWNLIDLSLLQVVSTEHSDAIEFINIPPNRQLIATASSDKSIKLWSITYK